MEPIIKTMPEKKLIGKRLTMSMANNRTFELWKSFMSRRKEIHNAVGTELFSMQIYDSAHDFNQFNPHVSFEKWAAVEVTDFTTIPDEMESIVLVTGLYAVFLHRGSVASGPATFQYIFGTWFPNSQYVVDNRPHFEILGEKYDNHSSTSEEEIWIPIRNKVSMTSIF